MGRLSNRTCMVTGAARGIGMGIADALLAEGGNVVYADLDKDIVDIAAKAKDRVGSTAAARRSASRST